MFVFRFGRKNLLLASYVVTTVFGFASAFANSYAVFAVLRFFTGFGITGLSVISLVLSKFPSTPHVFQTGIDLKAMQD